MSNIIQGLWIGDSLSVMERMSIQSFLHHGHEYHLYIYSDIKNIPEGTTIKDGNEIVSESKIFKYKNGSYSAFSNYFRFTLLHKKGGYWADTDLICVRTIDINEPYVFTTEPQSNYSSNYINAGLIKIPKESEVSEEALQIQEKHRELIISGQMGWSSGPKTVQHLVKKFNLQKYVLPWQGICSCLYSDVSSIINPAFKRNPQIIMNLDKIPDIMYGIHLWNEIWRRHNLDKNATYHKDSLYEQLKRKYYRK